MMRSLIRHAAVLLLSMAAPVGCGAPAPPCTGPLCSFPQETVDLGTDPPPQPVPCSAGAVTKQLGKDVYGCTRKWKAGEASGVCGKGYHPLTLADEQTDLNEGYCRGEQGFWFADVMASTDTFGCNQDQSGLQCPNGKPLQRQRLRFGCGGTALPEVTPTCRASCGGLLSAFDCTDGVHTTPYFCANSTSLADEANDDPRIGLICKKDRA